MLSDDRQAAISVDGRESFSGGRIKELSGIHLQSLDEIFPLVSEEIRLRKKFKADGSHICRRTCIKFG